MPQFVGNIYRKNKKHIKNGRLLSIFLSIVMFLVSILLIFNVSDIFSSLITHKKGLFFSDRIEITSYCIYGVSAKDFEREEDAQNYAKQIIPSGAMGEVYHHGEYFVLTSTYPTLIEAQEVQNNLLSLGYNARIVNISVPQFLRDYRGSDKGIIENAMYNFREIYTSLYHIDVEFDKGNLSRSSFSGQIAQVLTEFKSLSSKISKSSIPSDYKSHIISSFDVVTSLMEEVLYSAYSNFETSSLLKRNMYKIVEQNIALVQSV